MACKTVRIYIFLEDMRTLHLASQYSLEVFFMHLNTYPHTEEMIERAHFFSLADFFIIYSSYINNFYGIIWVMYWTVVPECCALFLLLFLEAVKNI